MFCTKKRTNVAIQGAAEFMNLLNIAEKEIQRSLRGIRCMTVPINSWLPNEYRNILISTTGHLYTYDHIRIAPKVG